MKKKTLEILLYAAIFCLAAALRFHLLGASPLMEGEADAALKAFQLSKGQNVVFDAQAGYVLLTSVVFYFFKSSEFAARFLPALAGSLIVFSPLLYRKHLGSLPALLLAVGLAIDPALIISSRTADGSIFGITFFLFGLGCLLNGRSALAGIFTALALLGGNTIWFGMCVSLLTAAAWYSFRKTGKIEKPPVSDTQWKFDWKLYSAGLGVTIVLLFSVFMTIPDGLAGVLSGLVDFATGWSQPQSMSIGTALWSLLFYEGLPLLMGLVAVVLASQRRESLVNLLAYAALAALILIIAYPARGFSLFPWLGIPLWTLLCRYLLAEYSLEDIEKMPFFSLLAVILAVTVFAGINLKGMFTGATVDTAAMRLRVASVLGSMLIILLATGFVVWAWSISTAVKALFGAVLITMLVFNISTIWNVIRSPIESKQEVWLSNPFVDEDLFSQTIADYKRWNIDTGKQSIVMISGIDSSAVDWSLRMDDKIEHVQALPETFNPEMVVTYSSGQLLLESEYAGQDFILTREPVWSGLKVWDWVRWFFQRETPHVDQSIILWVRVDQFPGYNANELLPTD